MSQYPGSDVKWSSLVAAPVSGLKTDLPYGTPGLTNGNGARNDPQGVTPPWQGLSLPTWADSRIMNYHQAQSNPSLPPVSSLHSVPNQHYLSGGHFRSPQPPPIDPTTSQSAFAAVSPHPHHPPPPPHQNAARGSALTAQLTSANYPNPANYQQSQAMLRAMQQARQQHAQQQFTHQQLPTVPVMHVSPDNRPASVDQIQPGPPRAYLSTSGGMLLSPSNQRYQPAPLGSILHPGAYKQSEASPSGLLSIQTNNDSRLLNAAISDISPPGTISSSTSNYDTQTSTSIADSTRTAAAALLGMSEGDGGTFTSTMTPTRVSSSQRAQNGQWANERHDSPRPEISAPNSDTTNTTENFSEGQSSPSITVSSPLDNAHTGSIQGAGDQTQHYVPSSTQIHASNQTIVKEQTNGRPEVLNGHSQISPDRLSKEGREATPAREGALSNNDQSASSSGLRDTNIPLISAEEESDLATAPSKLVMALSDMHEPISPAVTPQRCASAAADSSTALIDVVSSSNGANGEQSTPQPTETNLRAAARLEEKIQLESIRATPTPTGPSLNFMPKMPFRPTPTLASPTLPMSRPQDPLPLPSPVKPGPGGVYTCEICSFTNESKFHFNSHMNTHTDHQCNVCDYRARTEGRLKRHMKEFHSEEDRVAAGVGTPEEEMRARVKHAAAVGLYQSPSMVLPPTTSSNDIPSSASNSPSALERMQMAFSKQEPMMSPSQTAMDMSSPDIPKTSAPHSSKPKKYGCKQCPVILYSKDDYWNHQRTHIKPEKLLTCPKCLFVTEYKHHLEYHLRNHFNSKPFKCTKCNYTCVNKSMLNSHMKSHSNFYQYRCADCTYATKYCHSLKLHLRKYGHQAVGGEGVSGSPPETDPFGNRRSSSEGKDMELGPPTMARYQSPAAYMTQGQGQATPQSNNLMEMILQQRKQQINAAMANSIATFGVQLPTISHNLQQAVQVSQMNAAAAGNASPMALNGLAAAAIAIENQQQQFRDQQNNAGTALKCRLCEYQCYSHKELIHHQLSNHAELAKFYGLMPPNLQQPQQQQHPDHTASGPESVEDQSPAMHRDSPSDGAEGSSGSPVSAEKCSGDEGSAGSGSGDHPNTGSSRRKGKAVKLDQISLRLQGRASPIEEEDSVTVKNEDMDHQESSTNSRPTLMSSRGHENFRPRASSNDTPSERMRSMLCNMNQQLPTTTSPSTSFVGECPHCGIAYKDTVMLTIHMGYHGYDNPFRCNRCGVECHDRLRFFMHIAQAPH